MLSRSHIDMVLLCLGIRTGYLAKPPKPLLSKGRGRRWAKLHRLGPTLNQLGPGDGPAGFEVDLSSFQGIILILLRGQRREKNATFGVARLVRDESDSERVFHSNPPRQ